MRYVGLVIALITIPIQTAIASQAAVRGVTTLRPRRRDIFQWVKLPSGVEADAEIVLYTKVTGVLERFSLDVGDQVHPGQEIGVLQVPELAQDVKLAEGQLESARADYQKALADLNRIKLHGAEIDAQQKVLEAQLQQAQARAEKTKKLFERTQKLFSDNAATEQEKETQEFTYQEDSAGILVSKNKIDALKADRELWQSDILVATAAAEEAKSKVAIAQANVDRASVWMSYASVKVPQVGTHAGAAATVTKRFVSNGDMIAGGTSRTGSQPIVTLTVSDPVRFVADVAESDVVGINAGTTAEVSLYSMPKEQPIMGKISRTTNSLSSASRTLRVEMDVPNPEGRIKPGMMASMQIATNVHKQVLAVPSNSVSVEKRECAVYTVVDGKAHRIPVQIGFRDHDWLEVISPDVTEVTPIISDVREGVSDGVLVDVKQP